MWDVAGGGGPCHSHDIGRAAGDKVITRGFTLQLFYQLHMCQIVPGDEDSDPSGGVWEQDVCT